jgi:SMP-30/Gluconolactonase/LRE-like region
MAKRVRKREYPLPDRDVGQQAGGLLFTEGPSVDGAGNVFLADIPNRRIHRWSVDGELSVFRAASGGANGLCFDRDGNLIACEMETRAIESTTPAGRVTVLSDASPPTRGMTVSRSKSEATSTWPTASSRSTRPRESGSA